MAADCWLLASHVRWGDCCAPHPTPHPPSPPRTTQHSGTSGVGENLMMSSGSATCSDAAAMWVAEARYYSGSYSPSTGHWTQVGSAGRGGGRAAEAGGC